MFSMTRVKTSKIALTWYMVYHMGRSVTKPVFGVSDQVIPKSACSATETS